jgi:hypothetical protein
MRTNLHHGALQRAGEKPGRGGGEAEARHARPRALPVIAVRAQRNVHAVERLGKAQQCQVVPQQRTAAAHPTPGAHTTPQHPAHKGQRALGATYTPALGYAARAAGCSACGLRVGCAVQRGPLCDGVCWCVLLLLLLVVVVVVVVVVVYACVCAGGGAAVRAPPSTRKHAQPHVRHVVGMDHDAGGASSFACVTSNAPQRRKQWVPPTDSASRGG